MKDLWAAALKPDYICIKEAIMIIKVIVAFYLLKEKLYSENSFKYLENSITIFDKLTDKEKVI